MVGEESKDPIYKWNFKDTIIIYSGLIVSGPYSFRLKSNLLPLWEILAGGHKKDGERETA